MTEFQIGDIVYLKSGSPRMTVCEILPDKVTVCWLTEGGVTVKTATFNNKAVTKIEPRKI